MGRFYPTNHDNIESNSDSDVAMSSSSSPSLCVPMDIDYTKETEEGEIPEAYGDRRALTVYGDPIDDINNDASSRRALGGRWIPPPSNPREIFAPSSGAGLYRDEPGGFDSGYDSEEEYEEYVRWRLMRERIRDRMFRRCRIRRDDDDDDDCSPRARSWRSSAAWLAVAAAVAWRMAEQSGLAFRGGERHCTPDPSSPPPHPVIGQDSALLRLLSLRRGSAWISGPVGTGKTSAALITARAAVEGRVGANEPRRTFHWNFWNSGDPKCPDGVVRIDGYKWGDAENGWGAVESGGPTPAVVVTAAHTIPLKDLRDLLAWSDLGGRLLLLLSDVGTEEIFLGIKDSRDPAQVEGAVRRRIDALGGASTSRLSSLLKEVVTFNPLHAENLMDILRNRVAAVGREGAGVRWEEMRITEAAVRYLVNSGSVEYLSFAVRKDGNKFIFSKLGAHPLEMPGGAMQNIRTALGGVRSGPDGIVVVDYEGGSQGIIGYECGDKESVGKGGCEVKN